MPIENRNLTKGTKLTGRYHKQSYSCEVVENAEGKLRYRSGGWPGIQESIGCRNGHHRACLRRLEILESANGRELLLHRMQRIKRLLLRQRPNQMPSRPNLLRLPPRPTPRKPGVFLVPNQKGVPEGQIRWFCRDCGKSFIASAVEVPGVCPNHSGQLKLT